MAPIDTYTVSAVMLMSIYQVTVSEIVTEIGPSTMPYRSDAAYQQVIGYDSSSNLIWLIGGRTWYRDYYSGALSFNVSAWDGSPFINHGTPSFFGQRPRVQCGSQCSVSLDDSIYFVNHFNNKNGRQWQKTFNKYIMSEPQSYEPTWNDVTDDWTTGFHEDSCLLLMDDQYLIVTGPHEASAGIYDIINGEWIGNVPSMNVGRYAHSCALNPKTKMVYVFGGADWDWPLPPTDTIEKLDVSNLNRMGRQSWTMLNATISGASSGHRAVFHRGLVYIIATPAGVDVFDVNTEECYVYGELAISVSSPAVIKVEPRIYIFGGYSGRPTNTWQYMTLDNARGSAAESEVLGISGMISNDRDNDNKIIEFSEKNVSGLSNNQLFLALVFGNTLIILGSVAIGVCIGKKMKQTQKYHFEQLNVPEEAL